MIDWKDLIEREWRLRAAKQAATDDGRFPLMNSAFDSREIVAAVESILSGQLTMSERVHEFERRFAQLAGSPYAVMVNSGSSANLLALAVVSNPARSTALRSGDEVLVPAVCWSTSLWPIIQHGLRPVLVDVDPATLNLSVQDARRRLTARTRAIVMVHVLGNSCDARELSAFAAEHQLLVIEDTCESLGSTAGGRWLGTLGAFGTFSFYYSHHLTTGEGGMVVCTTEEDYDLLKCLRAHGWSRELSNRPAIERQHPDLDPRFLFVNIGYNVRPLEIQAAIGLCQLDRLPGMSRARNANRTALMTALENHPAWHGQFSFPAAGAGIEPVWFGFAALLSDDRDRAEFLQRLSANGVENRPIISGNFARQPGLALHGVEVDPLDYPGAEEVHRRGFFIGLHGQQLGEDAVARLADLMLTT